MINGFHGLSGCPSCDQNMRHETMRQAKVKIEGKSKPAEVFIEKCNEEGFEERLKNTVADSNTKDARKLMREIRPILSVTGSNIGWSPFEHKNTVSHLFSLKYLFGLPCVWLTFAPNASNCPLVIKLSRGNTDENETPELFMLELKSLYERMDFVNSNPAACSQVFDMLSRVIFRVLFELDIDAYKGRRTSVRHFDAERKGGIFGKLKAIYGVLEAQARGALHLHALLFGEIKPEKDDPMDSRSSI